MSAARALLGFLHLPRSEWKTDRLLDLDCLTLAEIFRDGVTAVRCSWCGSRGRRLHDVILCSECGRVLRQGA